MTRSQDEETRCARASDNVRRQSTQAFLGTRRHRAFG